MIARLALMVLATVLVSIPVFGLESGGELLEKMTHSHRELNYRAIVTYQWGDKLSSYRITHTVNDGKEFEALESLDGEQLDLVRRGHKVGCIHLGPQLIRHLSHNDDQGLYRYYDIDIVSEGRIAGRDTVNLSVTPRDVYRLGYRLSLDSETGLLLRSDIVNQQGNVLERFQYVMLDLNIPANELLLKDAVEVKYRPSPSNEDSLKSVRRWQPNWIPAGFTPINDAAADSETLSYTDGFAVMSVFIEPFLSARADVVPVVEGGMRRGASVSYTVAFPDKSVFVTVVGEVPILTAMQVAKSLSWDQ